ncbi:hypothetical protein JCM8547_000040 [Rhodosporidiobolus lusitaniae]
MLDSLPTELVEHVVRFALSSSFLPHLYHDRLATLTSLCLTSSKLRSVAQPILSNLRSVTQPILFEVVQFKSRKAVNSFLGVVEADKALGARARSARLEDEDSSVVRFKSEPDEATFARLAASCPRVEDLRIFWQSVELGWRLRRLVHTNGRQFDFRPVSFPNLEKLSSSQNDFGELISCDFDTLENLGMGAWSSRTLVVVEDLWQDWWVDWNSKDLPPSNTYASTASTTTMGPKSAPRLPKLVKEFAKMLRELIKRLRELSVTTKLSSIYLPSAFNPDRDALSSLSSSNIEVVFETMLHKYCESLVSPKFWRRSRSIKAQKEQEGTEQETTQVAGVRMKWVTVT